MSQDQNDVSTNTPNGQPKRFLKKGEGLKRFAAYKPPPPTTTTETQKRQTFVRFKLENKLKRDQHYIDPDILLDDSINLSTEIPKIAPPKIMHTPIRPNHRPLAPISHSQINGNIDNLLKKIEERKSSLEEERRSEATQFASPTLSPHKHLNNHHCDSDSDREEQRKPTTIDRQVQVSPTFDLSTPVPGDSVLALAQHLQKLQQTVNELQEKIKNCECGNLAPRPAARRPTTRSQARAKNK